MSEAFLKSHPDLERLNAEILRSSSQVPSRIRNDSNAVAFLARELVFTRAEIERRIYEKMRASEFVHMDGSYPRGAESYATRMISLEGEAKVSDSLAGDHPRADVSSEEDLRKFVNVTASYAYTVDDLEKAAFAGIPLPSWKREAVVEVIARRIDQIAQYGTAGDPKGDVGLRGFFNNPNVTVHTLTQGEWLSESVDNILADLNEIESTIIAMAKDTQPGEYRLTLPTQYEGKLKTKLAGTASDMTVANVFLKNSRLIKVIDRYGALDTLTQPKIAASDAPQGICVPMNAQEAGIFMPMPIGYEEQPPEVRNFEWIVNARARVGGVEFRRPYWCLYLQNLD